MTVGESLVMAWVNALGPTFNVCFWHLASFAALQHSWSLLGQQRTLVGTGAEWLGRE